MRKSEAASASLREFSTSCRMKYSTPVTAQSFESNSRTYSLLITSASFVVPMSQMMPATAKSVWLSSCIGSVNTAQPCA